MFCPHPWLRPDSTPFGLSFCALRYAIQRAAGTGLMGTGWTEDRKQQVADRVLDKLATYAPNLKSSIIARRVESPAEINDRLGIEKGNYYHFDMTLDLMMPFRPLSEIANYQTPIERLFLTGAGTHPEGFNFGHARPQLRPSVFTAAKPLRYFRSMALWSVMLDRLTRASLP